MEPGLKRTTIARIAAGIGFISGTIGLVSATMHTPLVLAPHGWSNVRSYSCWLLCSSWSMVRCHSRNRELTKQ
jgi:hypothetical protein